MLFYHIKALIPILLNSMEKNIDSEIFLVYSLDLFLDSISYINDSDCSDQIIENSFYDSLPFLLLLFKTHFQNQIIIHKLLSSLQSIASSNSHIVFASTDDIIEAVLFAFISITKLNPKNDKYLPIIFELLNYLDLFTNESLSKNISLLACTLYESVAILELSKFLLEIQVVFYFYFILFSLSLSLSLSLFLSFFLFLIL